MSAHAAAKPRIRIVRFVTGIWGEMKKVIWLTRREAAYLTMLVLIVAIISAVVLGAFDYGFSSLADRFLVGG